jgi:DNA polymerase-3 subunit delta'
MLSWLQQSWDRLNQARLQGRLPHALLISGQDGCGKRLLARQLAGALLCRHPSPAGEACGACTACAWLQAETHPDLLWLEPGEPGKAIKVDQVRALCGELAMTSHAGGYKVAILMPADAMNVNAANSLLKTLEEPTDNTLLILISAAPGRLAATLRSRCQKVSLPTPDPDAAVRWLCSQGIEEPVAAECLGWAGGAPLTALELAGSDSRERRAAHLQALLQVFRRQADPLSVAADWLGDRERQNLEWWRDWLEEIVRWQQGGRTPADPDVARKLQVIVKSVDCRQLFDFLDRIANALDNLGSGLNRQLLFEDLFILWSTLGGPSSDTAAGGR